MKHCDSLFVKKHKKSPLSSAKSRLKLKEACEKCKKTLSVNLDASINVDCLMEDWDLSVSINRQAFEDLAKDTFTQFQV